MTQLLEKAYSQITKLPDGQQDAIATLILEAPEDKEKWTEQFAHSQDALAKVALVAFAATAGMTTLASGLNSAFTKIGSILGEYIS